MAEHDPEKFKRDLFRGSREVLVLAILAEGKQYGYAIHKEIKQTSDQTVQAGTMYPLLHRLESDGYIKATWDRSTARERKWYELTPSGQRALRKHAADWQAYIARLQGLVLPAVRRIAAEQADRNVIKTKDLTGMADHRLAPFR